MIRIPCTGTEIAFRLENGQKESPPGREGEGLSEGNSV